jgi:hypothetical protein
MQEGLAQSSAVYAPPYSALFIVPGSRGAA